MDKFIGIILMGVVVVICFYIFTNLDKINNLSIPVSENIIKYFKVKTFDSGPVNSTTTLQQ